MKLSALVLAALLPAASFAGSPKTAAPSGGGAEKAHEHAAGSTCHHPAEADPAKTAAKKEEHFKVHRGAKFSGAPAVKLEELLARPDAHDGKTVTLVGTVRRACQKKGCWMELAPSEKANGVRITFKDYAFFVPLDSGGAQAQVEGVVKVAELSSETAAHYEAEGAIVPRGKDGKPREVQLVASAVELSR